MPTKNSRRSRRPQATRQTLLTFEQAHPPVEQAVAALDAEWKKRRDERLQPFKSKPDAATNPQVYWDAADAEFATEEDPEPSAQAFLISKLRDGSLPFFVHDAAGKIVKGDSKLHLRTLAAIQRVLIGARDLERTLAEGSAAPQQVHRISNEQSAERFADGYIKSEKEAGRTPTQRGVEQAAKNAGIHGGRQLLRNAYNRLQRSAGIAVERGHPKNSPNQFAKK